MYNTIFSMIDLNDILPPDELEYFRVNYDYLGSLPEARLHNGRVLYQGLIATLSEIGEVERMLDGLGADPIVVGVWNTAGMSSGLQQGYVLENIGDDLEPDYRVARNKVMTPDGHLIDEPIPYPFNIEQYNIYLGDVVEYDENGNEVSRRRPTIEESRSIQVNSFSGQKKRDLETYP